MRRLLAVGALLATLLAASAFAATPSRPPATVVTSSRLVNDGHIRVTARIRTPVVVGRPLRVRWHVRNVSKHPRKIQLAYGSLWLVIRSADGTTYDTRIAFRGWGPYVAPITLRPGQTVSRSGPVIRVRWSGPLRITPGWYDAALPRVAVDVTAPGAPSARRAVTQVVAATGHLLDHCSPRVSGVSVDGWIYAPHHSAPPMASRCKVAIRRESGFDLAQVLITTPRAQRARVHWTYETISLAGGSGNSEAIAWQFVVTKDGATSVAAASVDRTKQAPKMAPYWEWTSAGHGLRPGGSHCGGTGGGGGGFSGPGVLFVSICR